MVRSAAQPLSTSVEPVYPPVNRTAVMSRCSRDKSAPQRSAAASANSPRTRSATGASASSARPSRSSLSNPAGTPNNSATAAEDAQPAMSYSGAGAHSRLATSAVITSPWVSIARPRIGTAASITFIRPSRSR